MAVDDVNSRESASEGVRMLLLPRSGVRRSPSVRLLATWMDGELEINNTS